MCFVQICFRYNENNYCLSPICSLPGDLSSLELSIFSLIIIINYHYHCCHNDCDDHHYHHHCCHNDCDDHHHHHHRNQYFHHKIVIQRIRIRLHTPAKGLIIIIIVVIMMMIIIIIIIIVQSCKMSRIPQIYPCKKSD